LKNVDLTSGRNKYFSRRQRVQAGPGAHTTCKSEAKRLEDEADHFPISS